MTFSRIPSWMKGFRLATTNSGKIASFHRAGFDFETIACEDTPEPDASLIEIVLEKSRRAGPGTIVEDTCFFIDGFPDAGTHIKYFEQQNKMPLAVGRRGRNEVGIGINDGANVYIFTAAVQGVIREPKLLGGSGLFDEKAYSFYFKPDGASDIFEHLDNEEAMLFSPRIKAMEKAAIPIVYHSHVDITHALWKASDYAAPAQGHWTGKWQEAN